ncbi:XdhC family aldehyde oxidoreductase maturation factor [Paucidesulfovibrio longus]|uniref:XdhC family aldehyde oxidoreductase maturation factor n=1 Tax=Paucidesulfovibrio longus TaxID=889 RepID=UPI0003B4DA23|nr:XdhC/CoxI family protein [Paucidesulfovibrio longus]
MNRFLRSVHDLLDQGEDLVLATIVASSGSTPRSSGAKMAVRRPGLAGERIIGTVGGGVTEAWAIRDAETLFGTEPGSALLRELNLNRDLAAGTDMICGGRFTLLLEYVTPRSPGAAALIRMDEALRKGIPGLLLFRLEMDDSDMAVGHTLLPLSGNTIPGKTAADADSALGATLAELNQLRSAALARNVAGIYDIDGKRFIAEPVLPPAPVFLYGAGHVSRCTAQVAALTGFRTVVLDDRSDFANAERFPDADGIVVLDSFENAGMDGGSAGNREPVGPDAFVVILTRGHAHDKTVLAQALRTPAKYIGMIGSRKKRDDVYAALRKEGFSETDIARCRCPIGISIGAQTPEEIALSIAAELVACRAGKSDPRPTSA